MSLFNLQNIWYNFYGDNMEDKILELEKRIEKLEKEEKTRKKISLITFIIIIILIITIMIGMNIYLKNIISLFSF